MKTIAIMNIKAGTGKSLTAYALSAGLIKKGFKVLAIDADWHGTLTEISGAKPEGSDIQLQSFLSEKEIFSAKIKKAPAGFTLIPCTSAFCNVRKQYAATSLSDALKRVERMFDYCIIDAPPCCDSWTENILVAAHKVIVPDHMAIPLAGLGYIKLLRAMIDGIRSDTNPDLAVSGVLLTQAEDIPNTKAYIQKAAEVLDAKVYKTEIRYDLAPTLADFLTANVFERYPTCDMAKDYERFVEEFLAGET